MHSPSFVYSPAQNLALWLQGWITGHVPFDDLHEVFASLGGPHRLAADEGSKLIDVTREVRSHCEATPGLPWLTLLLGGPGQPLPASIASDVALVLHAGQRSTVAIPHSAATGTAWEFRELELAPSVHQVLMPGEADMQLKAAVDRAAVLIEQGGHALKSTKRPRLTVGSLRDFYETPGLPWFVPERAAKLIARADYAAAIIETVTGTLGEHTVDPELLSIGRALREARMSAVAYSAVELGRSLA